MPVKYDVSNDGHVIIATVEGKVTGEEFIEYEVAHTIDGRVCPPVAELLVIKSGALERITVDDMRRVLERRAEIQEKHTPHRCAIVVQYNDTHSWNLAKFYEGMVMLHSPESVIVFGDEQVARIWLGIV